MHFILKERPTFMQILEIIKSQFHVHLKALQNKRRRQKPNANNAGKLKSRKQAMNAISISEFHQYTTEHGPTTMKFEHVTHSHILNI